MSRKLPLDVRMLVDDAESQAKRHGHGEVTPLHLVAAVAARGLAGDRLSAEAVRANERVLRGIEPDFSSPTLAASTKDLLAEVSDAPYPMQALIDLVVGLAAQNAADDSREHEEGGSRPAGAGPSEEPEAGPAAAARQADGEGSDEAGPAGALTTAQRRLVSVAPAEAMSVGRGALVHRLVSMLGARQPQPVLLVGDPGSGRTSTSRALAAELADDGYEGPLRGSAVYVTTTSELLAQRNWGAIAPLARQGVLFVDDADVLIRLGGGVDVQALAFLRSLVAAEGSRVILMLSSPNLDKFRGVDPEFLSQLEVCRVPDFDAEDVLQVAREEAQALQAHHGVTIPPEVVAAAAMPRRMSDTQSHPELAVRRLDRAAAAARLRADRKARAADLGSEVPAQQYVAFDADRARATLGELVHGQEQAIRMVTDRLSVTRAALDLRPERPDGVFLFAGPTGTGKTALALALAKEIYGSADAVIRLDMSEFAEPHTVSKLFGSPPGYVGSTDPDSWLTTRIRNRPHCVLLLDEIEKAHPLVWNSFLQVFDAGSLSDSLGNRADFAEVVVVMTSNIGAEAFAQRAATGFLPTGPDAQAQEADVLAELKRRMRPELLNRLDGTIVFRPLTDDAVREIASVNLARALRRLAERGWSVRLTPALEDLVVARGFSSEYGARPLLRTLEDLVLRPIAGHPPGAYQLDAQGEAVVVTPADTSNEGDAPCPQTL
jgi:ATP-dependent Clp protease ATP-binding subunit ClpA